MTANWNISYLLKSAFERTKSRLISYIAIVFIQMIIIGALVGLTVAGGILLISLMKASSTAFVVILGLVGLFGLIYVSSWAQLATIALIASDTNLQPFDAYKRVQPRVIAFFMLNLLFGFFMIGLAPFIVLSFGMVLLAWLIWALFLPFVFLSFGKNGFENVWISKQMTVGNFQRIMTRVLAVYVIFWIVFGLLGNMDNGTEASIVDFIAFLLSLFFGVFAQSYVFEIFKQLPKPAEHTKSTMWIVLSVIGGLIITVGIFLTMSVAMEAVQQYMKNPDQFMQPPLQKELKDLSPAV